MMKCHCISFLFLIFSFQAQALVKANEIQALLKKNGIKMSDVGVYISVNKGEDEVVLFENQSQKLMMPASLTKIATASAILSQFMPGTKFQTQLLSEAKITGRTLKGNLYFQGGGDPGFVSEDMWFLVNHFIRNQIDTIEGDIVVDDSLFDQVRYDTTRESTRVDRAYDAPVGGLSFNWNSVNVFVRPGRAGEKAQVFLDPENSYTSLENKVKTSGGGKGEVYADRKELKSGDLITVSGKISQDENEITIFKNITQPDLWAGHNLVSFLNQRGVQVKGQVIRGSTPSGALVLAKVESKPIEKMIADMNKFSNNFVAEMLTKQLSLQISHPGTIANGMAQIKKHLLEIGLLESEFKLINPSGLTRDNQITSKGLWKVLNHLKKDFRVYPEFLSSLPIAGIDGTLKRRMKGESAERWVRAKTGYINNVAALGGYAGLKNGQVCTFVMIYNGTEDEGKVRSTFDKILNRLVE